MTSVVYNWLQTGFDSLQRSYLLSIYLVLALFLDKIQCLTSIIC